MSRPVRWLEFRCFVSSGDLIFWEFLLDLPSPCSFFHTSVHAHLPRFACAFARYPNYLPGLCPGALVIEPSPLSDQDLGNICLERDNGCFPWFAFAGIWADGKCFLRGIREFSSAFLHVSPCDFRVGFLVLLVLFFFSTPNDASSLLTVNPEDPTRESKYQRNGVWLGNADLRLIFFPWFFFWFKGSGHGQPRILFRFLSSRSMSKGIWTGTTKSADLRRFLVFV